MKGKLIMVLAMSGFTAVTYASGITEFTMPFGNQLNVEGTAQITTEASTLNQYNITKSYYGADAHGFSALPNPALVSPLKLGYVKFGGSLHSMYNWEVNSYYDRNDNGIFYVYSPLERRIQLVQNGYKAMPMLQVNMLGWQPDYSENGKLIVQKTADAQHAADSITFLNGEKKLGLLHILMGNEPFESEEVHGLPIPSADEYIESYIQYAMALRNSQEAVSGNSNDIKLWGPEIATGWTGWQTTHPNDCVKDETKAEKMSCSYGNGEFSEFMPYFLYRIAQFEKDPRKNPKNYKLLDYITFHYYPLFRKNFKDAESILLNNDGTQNVVGMLESVNLWNTENYINIYDSASPKGIAPNIINKFKNWRADYYPNAKLAVTEFGVDSVDKINYHPIVRPLYLADLMARLGSDGVDTFVLSFLQGGVQENTWAMINGVEKTKLYNVYSLYSQLFLGKVLNTNDNFGDKINVYSAKNSIATNVFFVNKDNIAHSTDLSFKNGNEVENITQVTLPAWSVTVLSVPDDRRQLIKVYQYGAKEMGISLIAH
jgi:hypothetical protein